MKLVATVDENWGIGYKENPIIRVPDDIKRFNYITIGSGNNAVIMGRKTFKAFGSKLFPYVINIIVSRKGIDYEFTQQELDEGREYICFPDLLDAMDFCYDHKLLDKTTVIGGASIFSLLLPYCNSIYITKNHIKYPEIDTYFPCNLDKEKDISQIDGSLTYDHNGLQYSFCNYINMKPIKYIGGHQWYSNY